MGRHRALTNSLLGKVPGGPLLSIPQIVTYEDPLSSLTQLESVGPPSDESNACEPFEVLVTCVQLRRGLPCRSIDERI